MSNTGNDETDSAREQTKRLEFPPLLLKREVSTPLGLVDIRPLTVKAFAVLQEADRDNALDEQGFLRLLTSETVTRHSDKSRLTNDEVAKLIVDDTFVAELADGHSGLYTEFHDTGSAERKREVTIQHEPDESVAAFLLRAWREYELRARARSERLRRSLSQDLGGLTSALSKSGMASLLASSTASDRLRSMLARDNPYLELGARVGSASSLPPIPPNPIHETNRHLAELRRLVGQMEEIAAETAEMQSGLYEVATEILDKFVRGARAAEEAGSKNLKVARYGLWVAVTSVVVTLGISLVQLLQSGPTASEVAQQRMIEGVLKRIAEHTEQQARASESALKLQARQVEATAVLEKHLARQAPNNVRDPAR